jgi:peptidoglycan/xylan/chitin deacetylase (PgdA/CDA1 family)
MAGGRPVISFSYHGDRNDPKVAITVDDLNNPDVIRDGLLPFLAENPDVKVTLFPVGRNIRYLNWQIPNFWLNLLNAGHDVGFHSLNHDRLANEPAADILEEVLRYNELMGQAIGGSFRLRYGRATYGDYGETDSNFREVAEATGMIWILWSLSPAQHGYTLDDTEAIQNGDIAIFHDEWDNIERMRWFVHGCRERGLQMVSLSEMWLIGE